MAQSNVPRGHHEGEKWNKSAKAQATGKKHGIPQLSHVATTKARRRQKRRRIRPSM
jgi:hypothetical protein